MTSGFRLAVLLTILLTVQADTRKNTTALGTTKLKLFSERWADFEQRWLYNITDPIFRRILEPLANSSPFLNGTATGWLIDMAEKLVTEDNPKVNTMLTQFADKAMGQLTTALKEALLEGLRELNDVIKTMVTGTVTAVKDAAVKRLESTVKELTKKLMQQLPTIPKPSVPLQEALATIPKPPQIPSFPWKY